MSEQRRIGIVGGGASGLATAQALRKLGFSRVTVLEAGSEPGGKCCTFWHEGRSYELGAAIITPAYRHTWALAREYGIAPKLCLGVAMVDPASGHVRRSPILPPGLDLRRGMRLPYQIVRLLTSALMRHRKKFPRLDQVDPDFAEPFAPWCTRNGLESVLEAVRPWATAFGYGYLEDVPAAYMLNYMCLAGATHELLDQGYRGLWLRVARDLHVLCNASVTRIERGRTAKVFSTAGEFEFDDIIIACPTESALEFLDSSQEERWLFHQVNYVDYQVIAAQVSGMPRWRYVFVPKHFDRGSFDKPMFFYRRYPDRELVMFYSFRGRGPSVAREEVETLVRSLGGRVRSFVKHRTWRYFPHASSDSLRAGFYPRFEALQGVRNTFYVGEIMSFSCVEPVVAYAQDLVHRHFASRPDWARVEGMSAAVRPATVPRRPSLAAGWSSWRIG